MAEQPHLGGYQPGRGLGVVLYLLLALSLAVALVGDRMTWLPPAWLAAAPAAFGLFLVLFALYRFTLIRAGRYPFGQALFQVGAGLLFLAVLLRPGTKLPTQVDDVGALLGSGDPVVRKLACEVARYRPNGAASMAELRAHAESDVPAVRDECARTVQALAQPR